MTTAFCLFLGAVGLYLATEAVPILRRRRDRDPVAGAILLASAVMIFATAGVIYAEPWR